MIASEPVPTDNDGEYLDYDYDYEYSPEQPMESYDLEMIVKIQARIRGFIARKQYLVRAYALSLILTFFKATIENRRKRRRLIAEEVLSTEINYVKQLNLLANVYYEQLIMNAKVRIELLMIS